MCQSSAPAASASSTRLALAAAVNHTPAVHSLSSCPGPHPHIRVKILRTQARFEDAGGTTYSRYPLDSP